jgi:hypothetical protein
MIDGGLASTLSAMNDSVTFINSVIDGSYEKDWTTEEFQSVVRSNKIFLEQQLLKDYIIADDTDKTPYNDAINAANTFLQD